MFKILMALKKMLIRQDKVPDLTNAIYIPTKDILQKKFQDQAKELRQNTPEETMEQGDLALSRFMVNHRYLAKDGERKVLHDLTQGKYGKIGSPKHDYVAAWLKDAQYARETTNQDENLEASKATVEAAREANIEAREANRIARRALLTARVSAATAVIALTIAMATSNM